MAFSFMETHDLITYEINIAYLIVIVSRGQ